FNNILPEGYKDFNDEFWENVIKNNIKEKDLPIKDKLGNTIWLKAFFKPVEYMPGFVRKVNMIGYPIVNAELIVK
ncbi:MAG: hypothetical protein M3512_10800, partial [Bacteroidota bacterium]|nr:hypothetical protein [Bacteroidota bacterium]